MVLQTIVSRCHKIYFPEFSDTELKQLLAKNMTQKDLGFYLFIKQGLFKNRKKIGWIIMKKSCSFANSCGKV